MACLRPPLLYNRETDYSEKPMRTFRELYKAKDGKACQARLRERFHYDPATGIFTWKAMAPSNLNSRLEGKVAGSRNIAKTGRTAYTEIMLEGYSVKAHILAWLYVHGEFPPAGKQIDHQNKDGRDNRLCNLRIASRSQQKVNGRMRVDNTSGITGYRFVEGHAYRNSPHRVKIKVGDRDEVRNFPTKQQALEYLAARRAEVYGAEWLPNA